MRTASAGFDVTRYARNRLCTCRYAPRSRVQAARAQPRAAKRTRTQPAASEASRIPTWRQSRHPLSEVSHHNHPQIQKPSPKLQ